MKKVILFLIMFILVGCATTSTPQNRAIPELNIEKIAGIGDIFFIYEERTFVDPAAVLFLPSEYSSNNNIRFDLTIVSLDDQKIGLNYSEYFYHSGWKIKEGFNKRFDYTVTDGIVRFKGYEFEIISIEKGQIKYRRIK